MNQTRLFNDDDLILKPSKWQIKQNLPHDFEINLNVPELQAHVLFNRGITSQKEAESFLIADDRLNCDHGLLPNISAAVDLVSTKLNTNQRVAVFGDFDVDGISGTAILSDLMSYLGAKHITYIPHRVKEGHSLNESAIHYLKSQDVSLIITVDCGTTAFDEVNLAKSLGINVVITDHHIANERMPDDVPVINPGLPESKYPFQHLTGAGVALKFAEAVCENFNQEPPKHWKVLAALGTIADLGPLIGENRFIVKQGLEMLKDTDMVGIRALARQADVNLSTITARDLSFTLIPRLNAAGRLDSADTSLEILTTKDASRAEYLAGHLEQLNTSRRGLTTKAIKLADKIVAEKELYNSPSIFIHEPTWHPGILGLIAGRLSEKHSRPVVAACTENSFIRASARGPKGFEILQAMIETKLDFLKIGGHSQAAGFMLRLEQIQKFKENFNQNIRSQSKNQIQTTPITYDCEIKLQEINSENLKFLKSLEPFGQANPEPVFLTRKLKVYESRTVGKTGSHIKMVLGDGSTKFDAIAFRLGERFDELGAEINAVYKLRENYWGGQITIQLQVIDFQ